MADVCPDCRGTGMRYVDDLKAVDYTYVDEEGKLIYPQLAEMCDCIKPRELKKAKKAKLKEANFPESIVDPIVEGTYSYETYFTYLKRFSMKLVNEGKNEYEEFLNNPNSMLNEKFIWLWGVDDNIGHTSLALLLGMKLVELKVKVKFIKMNDLLQVFHDFENKAETLANISRASVIILDDAFDTSRCFVGKGFTQISLFNWMDTMVANKKLFICTSNIAINSIANEYRECKCILLRQNKEIEIKDANRGKKDINPDKKEV